MGWGWRHVAASGVAISVLLGLAADFARPGAQGVVLESHASPLTGKVRTAALGLLVVGTATLGANEAADGDNKARDRGIGSAVMTLIFAFSPFNENAPLPSWAVLALVTALLAAMTSRTLHRRPLPSPESEVSETGRVPLLFAAPSRGPLFRQPIVYANLAYTDPGPGGGLNLSGGLRGFLEVSRRFGDDAWVLPFGEPGA